MQNIHNIDAVDLTVFSHIDINLYPLFVAIFEYQSISKAAALICISQSAASHALQRLRHQFKDDLFVRSGSKMLATPYAQQIYPAVKSILFSIQNISLQQQSFDPSHIQQIKIAIHDEIEPIIFPKLVNHFKNLGLHIQFNSIKLDRQNLNRDLLTQQIDFVIDLEQKTDSRISYQTLVTDYFVVCGVQQHLNKDVYIHSPHIGVSSRRSGVLIEDVHFLKQNIRRDIFLRCQHYSTALQILKDYPNALLTLPQSILNHLHMPKELNVLKNPFDLPLMNIGIYWNSATGMSQRYEFLLLEIKSIFA